MRRNFKKIMSLMLLCALFMTTLLTGCSSNSKTDNINEKKHKIGVALYTDTGKAVEAIKAFLGGISKDINTEFIYTTLTVYDEATNKSKIQQLISAGAEGIIMTADMGTVSILQECEKAGVYLGGFLCDYNLSYNTAFDKVFKNKYFVGTVADGKIDLSDWGKIVAEDVIKKGYKNIGVLTFPEYAYPNQKKVDETFRTVINEYNKTADASKKINVIPTQVLEFKPLDSTYLTKNANLDAIFSIAAGAINVYPTLVASGKTNIKLYTSGFEGKDDAANFGSLGNRSFQQIIFSSPEAIVYPLVQLIDKLNGKSYSDAPAVSERVDSGLMIISNDKEMETVKTKSIYYTANFRDSFLTSQDVRNLCVSYNKDATYAKLIETVKSLTVDNLMKK
ncbi:hypothetical protein M2651_02810 [Clostridium sp. SYSU_GA19001]|uniref:sugar ABC transporter substrate-binding protein n=1 Tax=Clostridium caldaquaticum TaxID=2940653 RepID=UPI00207760B5|nr:hypothetical protein [Clostridium caldaquaticum]MCM8709955.1 hypothetical protein [Clostridium caldaquaticum]